EPKTVADVNNSCEKSLWDQSMDEEIKRLVQTSTRIETQVPPGQKVIGTKWAYKRKINQSVEVVSYKARLCALGYKRIWGMNFFNTYTPTIAAEVLKMLGFTANKDWELVHWDIKQAFVTAKLEEEVYVQICDGCGEWSGKTVRLLKLLYGIKQASREFDILLANVLTEIGLEQSAADPCVLHLMCDGDVCAYVGTHVDDLMVGGEAKVLEWLKSRVQEYLEISDLGNLSVYMGCEIVRDRNARTIAMTQSRYISDMV
ncbi:unnamed protein product, partial [Discosporangium mesarthrocarpum]